MSSDLRSISQQGNKCHPQACFPAPGPTPDTTARRPCPRLRQHFRCTLKGGHPWFPVRFPFHPYMHHHASPSPSRQQASLWVMPMVVDSSHAPIDTGVTTINPSPLRPNCRAEERIFLWKGINPPPAVNDSRPDHPPHCLSSITRLSP